MEIQSFFPVWDRLTAAQRELITSSAVRRNIKKGIVIQNGSTDYAGLLLIRHGQMRAHILSEKGREITLYRLFDRDICLFSVSCIIPSIQFEVSIEAEKDTELWVIPAGVYKGIMEQSAPVANFTNEIMCARLSRIVSLIEQIMWKSVDKRLAAFLLEESALEATNVLKLTHETIANHLGTAREVVTRTLRSFQREGMVKLSRGTVEITDKHKLEQLRNT